MRPVRMPDRKYPRVCGEERLSPRTFNITGEIPPRVRGRAARSSSRRLLMGNTPACAGKSPPCAYSTLAARKYPRVCGEEPSYFLLLTSFLEIPPRVRGRVWKLTEPEPISRNTPACAGKSLHLDPLQVIRWKYPRVCGEEAPPEGEARILWEIPPRVRGRVLNGVWGLITSGNTPACAGKSC